MHSDTHVVECIFTVGYMYLTSMDFHVSLEAYGIACEVCFLFNVQVNNFSVMSGRSHRFLGINSTSGPCEGNKHTCTSKKTLCEGDSMRIEGII